MPLFTVDADKCGRCGACVNVCPGGLLEKKDVEGAVPTPIEKAEEYCIHCGHCVAVCPKGALTLIDVNPEDCEPVNRALHPNPDNLEHYLRARRSIRKYQEHPVPEDILTRLIEIARYGPSGSNKQPVHWLVIEKPERFAGLVVDWLRLMITQQPEWAQSIQLDRVVAAWEQGINRITRGAPHLIMAHAPKSDRTAQAACTIALTNLTLAAPAFHLGTCWSGYFNTAAGLYPPLVEALGLPSDHQPFGSLVIGFPKFVYHRLPVRKPPPITWR